MIKIDIISGFLGAGKTTFIKKMLDEVYTDEKIALIENELGEYYGDEFWMYLLFFGWGFWQELK